MEFKKHCDAAADIIRSSNRGEPVIVEVMGCSWSVTGIEASVEGNEWSPPSIHLEPVLGAPTVDKPAGGAPLELEGLKFTAHDHGVRFVHNRLQYGLTWKAAAKLVAWLCVEVDKHRAPVAPIESLALHRQWLGRVDDLSPEALTAAVWSGEGLPPVGCVCEVQCADGGWHKCETIAHHLDNAVFAPDANYPYGVYDGLPAGRFRPLRTVEQLAAEARKVEVDRLCKVVMAHPQYHYYNRNVDCSAALRLAVEAIVDSKKFDADA